MKKFLLTLTLASLAFGSVVAQKKPSLKQVNVSAQTINSQSAGKPYTLNLTRAGTIYNLAAGVDYNRINMHTARGDMTLAELVRKSGETLSGRLIVGMTSDLRAMKIGRKQSGRLNYKCDELTCVCYGDADCDNLFSSSNCGPHAVCSVPKGVCACLRI